MPKIQTKLVAAGQRERLWDGTAHWQILRSDNQRTKKVGFTVYVNGEPKGQFPDLSSAIEWAIGAEMQD